MVYYLILHNNKHNQPGLIMLQVKFTKFNKNSHDLGVVSPGNRFLTSQECIGPRLGVCPIDEHADHISEG